MKNSNFIHTVYNKFNFDMSISPTHYISFTVKEVVMEQMFEPAAAIVERVRKDIIDSDDFSLPEPVNLQRVANHHRQIQLT